MTEKKVSYKQALNKMQRKEESIHKRVIDQSLRSERDQEELKKLKKEVYRANPTYKEERVNVVISKRPKRVAEMTVGTITFLEDFIDEDTGEVISIERNVAVRKGYIWDFSFLYNH